MTIIQPTVGRRVWYWPSPQDRGETEHKPHSLIQQGDTSQPCDAGIAYVHGPGLVNLTVADHNGVMHQRTSVVLLQGDEKPAPGQAYAQWMPYQQGQAAKSAA